MTDNVKSLSGTLYVVATPIGNLEDISARAARILVEVSLIACEDTRHTKKLLNHLQISTPLTSYYREKERSKTDILISKMEEGQDIALVSDAGTPALSDPGSVLVQHARSAGIPVIPIPGPSAITAAISAAGLDETGFFFGGFLPAKKSGRRSMLKTFTAFPFPLVFYESPHRIISSLQDCITVLGNRPAMLFRELTKIHEECIAGTLSDIIEKTKEGVRGELVLIIHGKKDTAEDKPDNLKDLLLWYKNQDTLSLKDAVSNIARDLDLPRGQVYAEALAVWKMKE